MTTQNTNTPAEPVASGSPSGGSSGRGGLLALLSVALVGGVMYSAYQFGKRPGDLGAGETSAQAVASAGGIPAREPNAVSSGVSASAGGPPTLLAGDQPLRSAPTAPGGQVAPEQARAAYESIGARPIEPASARVVEFAPSEETERPAGPMTARALESADSAALRARNTEIHSVGLAAVPPRAEIVRPVETFALNAPERDLSAPGLAAALSSGGGAAGAPAAQTGPRSAQATAQAAGAAAPPAPSGLGPVAGSTSLGGPAAPAPNAPRGPTLAAAQAQAQAQAQQPGAPFAAGQPASPGGVAPIGPSVVAAGAAGAQGGPQTAVAAATVAAAPISEAPQAAPAPRPRPAPAAAPSVVSQVRAQAGINVAAPAGSSAAMVARTQQAAAPAPQPSPATGFAPQAPRVFAPGEATMTLGQEFAAAAAGVDPRLAQAQAQAEAQRLAQLEAQRQAEALRLAQAPAQPPLQNWGAPPPGAQYAAVPQGYAPQPQPQAAPAVRGGAQIQLGALPSPDLVQQRWFLLQRSNPDLLGGLQLDIQPVTTGAGQQLFRLRAGPLLDFGSARNLCAALQARGVDCYAPPS